MARSKAKALREGHGSSQMSARWPAVSALYGVRCLAAAPGDRFGDVQRTRARMQKGTNQIRLRV